MALYPQYTYTAGGLDKRTHTNLVRSEGDAPAEQWIVDPDLPALFEYSFGGFGNVVIPKGMIVAVTTPKYDWETEKVTPCLTIATGSNVPVGVAAYSIYEKKRDRFDGNYPTVITRNYIEVPFIVGSAAADQMKWGCATAASSSGIVAGDMLMPDAKGRFVKWNLNKTMVQVFTAASDADAEVTLYLNEPIKVGAKPTVVYDTNTAVNATNVTVVSYGAGIIKVASAAMAADGKNLTVTYISQASDPVNQIVGQAYAVETDLPPRGWLAYFLNMDAMQNQLTDAAVASSYPPATAGGYPGTADWSKLVKQLFDKNNPTGIKYLTDGYFRAKTTVGTTDTPVVITANSMYSVVAATTGVSINAGTGALTVPDAEDNQIILQAKYPIARDEALSVYFDGTKVTEGKKYSVDYNLNRITLYPDYADTTKAVTIAHVLIKDQVPGLPTEWDYQGSVGAVRILLNK